MTSHEIREADVRHFYGGTAWPSVLLDEVGLPNDGSLVVCESEYFDHDPATGEMIPGVYYEVWIADDDDTGAPIADIVVRPDDTK